MAFSFMCFESEWEYIYIGGAYDKFPDFCMGTFIDNTHIKIYSSSK